MHLTWTTSATMEAAARIIQDAWFEYKLAVRTYRRRSIVLEKRISLTEPETYDSLMGYERLYLLERSSLRDHVCGHAHGTCQWCDQPVNRWGRCVIGHWTLHDILTCRNCNAYGFPCLNCLDYVKTL